MGPKPLFTAAETTEDEDSEADGEAGSTIMPFPFSCTEQIEGEPKLLAVLLVVVLVVVQLMLVLLLEPLVEAIAVATRAPALLTATADEDGGTAAAAPPAPVVDPPVAAPTAMGLVIFM